MEQHIYPRHQLGKKAEHAAKQHLEQHGLQCIEANYFCKYGEIDLIMKDKTHDNDLCIVFVEVRMKTDNSFVSSLESITRKKQMKIIRSAAHYLQKQKWFDKVRCRFDVVGVESLDAELHFHWIKNAFTS
ncbi:MAG: YraN family protein [Pseudomonadota bacterium]|nr:YraN family protein [Gammaproteobacteria bacterium]MBU1558860.1 YraN family protein [Gammaproteobacteria bacterium]MBU1628840.1 YraN family protein [Gammaproteobacteria bacterium]MBU1927260.1 YraN family protein [Gammaproteobacteria bacterium]MBU2545950.1 YraN family protein [Gammaproteobacteria bacterium]